ncbi:MAG TPA: thiamine pyrophosphate-binding protein [Syntrophus sp. (in: bacteria)]|nr:thiamine pyrophosphate-binding protein [Syntrophus sp. (in: bacteria)]
MGMIYGGHLLAKYLRDVEGVKTVFSLAGGHIDRIYDGFLEYGVRIVDVRHEQAAAMMAHAWSIYGPHAGVCLVTAGPGYTNALTGLVNASLDNVPIVVISGMAPRRDWDRGALQGMNQAAMVQTLVKWSGVCHDIRRIPEYVAKAFRHAVAGRPGPVLLEIPPDVLNVKVEEAEVPVPRRGGRVYRSAADEAAVREAAGLIDAARKPFILGGSGVGFSDCEAALAAFVEKTGIPFLLMDNGRGALPDDHPLSLWDGGQMALMTALSTADLIVVLGIRYNWLLMFGQIFPQAKVVRVDIDATEIDRNRETDVGLVGDMGLVLAQLNGAVAKRGHGDWLKALKDMYLPMVAAEVELRGKASDPIHPARLVERIRETAPDDAIFIADGGDTCYFALMGLTAKEKGGVLVGAGGLFGCLGTGIPFGIGAKLARPEKTVVVVNGDGSFGLNAMEFDTAVRHGIPFVCVICNDQAWGMIKHGQEMTYGNDRCVGSGLGVVRYDRVVEALGGHGEFVTKDDEIVPALERALASGKPACVNVITDPCVTSPATLMFVDALTMEK